MKIEIVSLEGKLHNKDRKHNFENNTKILYHIFSSQGSVYDKSGLEYNQNNTKIGSSSMLTENEKISYVDTIRDSVKKEDCKPLKEDIKNQKLKKFKNMIVHGCSH